MKNNKKTGGSKRAAIEKMKKIAKAAGSALVTGATAVGVTATVMRKPKILIAIGPLALTVAGKIAIPKLIAAGAIAATGGAVATTVATGTASKTEKALRHT